MPKYLFRGSYTKEGTAGVLSEGGTARAAVVEGLITSLGGTLESLYWAFGEDDFIVIADLPDAASAAAGSLTVGASGALRVTTTRLMDAAETDAAVAKSPQYRPPGS